MDRTGIAIEDHGGSFSHHPTLLDWKIRPSIIEVGQTVTCICQLATTLRDSVSQEKGTE